MAFSIVRAANSSSITTIAQSEHAVIIRRGESRRDVTAPSGDAAITDKIKASELLIFLETKIIPTIPPSVLAKLSSPKVTIVLDDDAALDGLFEVEPGLASNPAGYNEENLKITIRSALFMGPNSRQLLTHEFFHAVHHVLHPGEEAWVREGLAQFFEFKVLGYFNGINFAAAMRSPETSLIGSYSIDHLNPAQYGHNLQFFYYLATHCDDSELFWKIARGQAGVFGIQSVSKVLKDSKCGEFSDLALKFEIARIHNHATYPTSHVEPGLARNDKTYFLYSTTLPGATPRNSISSTEIQNLLPWMPLVLDSSAKPPVDSVGQIQRIWIQSSFPFAVQMKEPSPAGSKKSSWRQIIIKK